MNTIDVAAEALGDILPMLTKACRIIGSEHAENGVVRLVVAGVALRPGHLQALILREELADGARLTITFKPAPEGKAP